MEAGAATTTAVLLVFRDVARGVETTGGNVATGLVAHVVESVLGTLLLQKFSLVTFLVWAIDVSQLTNNLEATFVMKCWLLSS